jgi:phage terminase large subunit-like protein
LRALPRPKIEAAIRTLSDEQAYSLFFDWEIWARDAQLLPSGDWQTWLVLAGRGFGKTRTGAESVRAWIKRGFRRVNLIAPTSDDARDIMVEGESGILAVCPSSERPYYRSSKSRLEWPNGARSLIFTADEPERLRGKQHQKLWADEIASWRYPESWDQAMMGLRLGPDPQVVATTTPRPIPLIKELMAAASTVVSRGTTYENRPNLAPKFVAKVISKYEGTRLGRQELNAEILDDNPRALWHRSNIDQNRVTIAPELSRIVVGLDPNVKNRDRAELAKSSDTLDEAGIIVVGEGPAPAGWSGVDGSHLYVLDDRSLDEGPAVWGKAAAKAYHDHAADRIIGEVNNGGDMVEATIRAVDINVSYKSVTASRGKAVRAEPIAALYEQGRVHHVGSFPQLEDEMCDFDPITTVKSPNRMDALVWAATELTGDCATGMLDFMKGQAAAANVSPQVYLVPTVVQGFPTPQ